MGREVGGGIGMGKTCEPKAFSFQCMTKFTTKKKKKNTGVGFHALFQGNLPISGIKHMSLKSPELAGRFFTTSTTWEALKIKFSNTVKTVNATVL